MTKLLIHIGLHKTATTYLQNNYFPALKGLTYFRYNVPHIYTNIGIDKFEDTVLISNEGISGTPWNRDWKYGKPNDFHWIDSFETSVQNLKQLHPNAIPIIFFRKHGDLLISMYKQYVQEGGILTFDEFYGDEGVIREDDLSYQKRMEILEDYFSEVYILSFEKFKKEGDVYLDRFFSEFGITTGERHIKKERANVSISGKKVELLRNTNKVYNLVPVKARKLLRLMRISPRDIMQQRLAFWDSPDSLEVLNVKEEVNEKFVDDWKAVISNLWHEKGSTIQSSNYK